MRSKKTEENLFKKIFFSSQGLPIFALLALLTIGFVVFRMKSLDFDYRTNEINTALERAHIENKDLKAKKARLLSTRNLRELAARHNLTEPTQKQIIVVP